MYEIKLTASPEKLKEKFFALKKPEDIAELLEVSYKDFVYWIYRTPERYRYISFTIPKKHGTPRYIDAPNKNIKILQQKLNYILQIVFRPKYCVHGFTNGRSVVTNAAKHVRRRYVLNVDLKDFFPSIHFGRVRGMFMGKPYNLPSKVATFLAHLCCYKKILPQGAPTSPVISNMICAKMDSELQRLAASNHCSYTRYADDISFSTSRYSFPSALATINDLGQVEVGKELGRIITENGFQIHSEKIWLRRKDRRQEVTGIIVNERTNLPRKFTNNIRAMLHAWEKYGLKSAQKYFEEKFDKKHRAPWKKKPQFQDVLKGKIEYLGMVKGKESSTYLRFLDELGHLAPELTGGRGTPQEILLRRYEALLKSDDPHGRGYLLQTLLSDVFKHFNVTIEKSFTRNKNGEQIDGAFNFEDWYYIVECRWRKKVSDIREVDGLLGQVNRSGKQTMGVFFSINGWSQNVPTLLKQNTSKSIILVHGDDFHALLSQKISLDKLLKGKISELNLKSEPFISAEEIIKKNDT